MQPPAAPHRECNTRSRSGRPLPGEEDSSGEEEDAAVLPSRTEALHSWLAEQPQPQQSQQSQDPAGQTLPDPLLPPPPPPMPLSCLAPSGVPPEVARALATPLAESVTLSSSSSPPPPPPPPTLSTLAPVSPHRAAPLQPSSPVSTLTAAELPSFPSPTTASPPSPTTASPPSPTTVSPPSPTVSPPSPTASPPPPPVFNPYLTFSRLPPELRHNIIKFLVDHWRGRREPTALAPYATVSREFQAVVEAYLFATLTVNLGRLPNFVRYVVRSRRRCVHSLFVHVCLPTYDNDPCEIREGWRDKLRNNTLFTETMRGLFKALADWEEHEVVQDGISVLFAVSSPSDLRNVPFDLWQRRRWNNRDIGEKRFIESCIDFVGQDEETRQPDLLQPVHAVTSFATSELNRRVVTSAAYADIISKLPRLRAVHLELTKDKRPQLRKESFDQFARIIPHWSRTIECLSLSGNTHSSWREIPHEQFAEKDTGKNLCEALRHFASHLKHLSIHNLVRALEFMRPVWPRGAEDRDPFLSDTVQPSLPVFYRLQTVNILYGSVFYHHEWMTNSNGDLNENAELVRFRQALSLAAARLASNMPQLRCMRLSQRPLMWAGKHQLVYLVGPPGAPPPPAAASAAVAAGTGGAPMLSVSSLSSTARPVGRDGWHAQGRRDPKGKGPEEIATLTWTSTFKFEPWERTIEAWGIVAKNQELDLDVRVVTESGWLTDGFPPSIPGVSF